MAAVAVARVEVKAKFREGTIDFDSPTWNCVEHKTKMRIGRECPFCAVDAHGDEVLDALAF